jgi:nucleotide-binding universal stress UspA family protein
MIKIDKILVPVDFSEPSKTAVRYGLSLALQLNARLVLAHIVPSSTALIYTFPVESFAFEKEQAKYAKSTLPSLVAEEFRDRVNLQTIVKVGEIRSELLGIVRDEGISLVVMGAHGRSGLDRLLLGSLTERMLRKLPVPILTVSHLNPAKELHNIGPVPLSHILYATDLSDSADVGLKFSTELARGTGARLTALHVFTPVETLYWGAESGYLPEELESLREDTLERLWSLLRDEPSDDVKVTPLMTDGEPSHEILRVADETNVDMIVMNIQSKTIVERALLGTTAERVIRSAHVPVLSVPATGVGVLYETKQNYQTTASAR